MLSQAEGSTASAGGAGRTWGRKGVFRHLSPTVLTVPRRPAASFPLACLLPSTGQPFEASKVPAQKNHPPAVLPHFCRKLCKGRGNLPPVTYAPGQSLSPPALPRESGVLSGAASSPDFDVPKASVNCPSRCPSQCPARDMAHDRLFIHIC